MRLRRSKVLVAGGAGFVGSNLVSRLSSIGAEVTATVHRKSPAVREAGVEYVHADLTRADDCRKAVKGADYVFMCAANTSGAAVIATNPLVHVTANIVMNTRMLEASYLASVRKFVWLSSSVGYPPTGTIPVAEDRFFDGDPYDAYFASGWMKRYTEILCRMYSEKLENPMATVVLRPSNIYGPHDKFDPRLSHFTAALVRKVVRRENPIVVWGDGNDVRDLIYVGDFVDATLLAAEKVVRYVPINVGFGRAYRIKDVLAMLLELEGYSKAKVIFDPSGPSTIPARLIDVSRARRLLGFRPRTTLRRGLEQTVGWYRDFVEKKSA